MNNPSAQSKIKTGQQFRRTEMATAAGNENGEYSDPVTSEQRAYNKMQNRFFY
jgi:hypothetical protein